MTPAPNLLSPGDHRGHMRSAEVLIVAAFFGLITGMVEGAGLALFSTLHWMTWRYPPAGGGPEIFWISTGFDLVLFLSIACLLLLAGRWIRWLRSILVSIFIFTWCLCISWIWIVLYGRLSYRSILILGAGLASVFVRWSKKRETRVLQFCRGGLPWVVTTAALSFVFIAGGGWIREKWAIAKLPQPIKGSPNVLLIIVDTLRSDHLSAYGYEWRTSPNIDQVAQEGVLFDSAFAPAPWSLPSHASMLTAQLPHVHRAEVVGTVLDGRYTTLPEVLRARGYYTAAFSGNTEWFSREVGLARGFIHFEDCCRSLGGMIDRTVFGRGVRKLGGHHADRMGWRTAGDIVDATLAWIGHKPNHPFFVTINFFDVHDPQLLLPADRGRVAGELDLDRRENSGTDNKSEPRLPYIQDYDASVRYVDENFARLFQTLLSRGLLENTVVIVTSDHGELLGEHGLFHHMQSLYRPEIQVPLIFWWPHHLSAGVRIHTPVSVLNMPATVMTIVDGPSQAAFPGETLSALWTPGAQQKAADPIVEGSADPWSLFPQKGPLCYGWMKSVVDSEWQYIVHEKFGESVYRWREDRSEMNDQLSTPLGQAAAKILSERLSAASPTVVQHSSTRLSAVNATPVQGQTGKE